MNEETFPIRLGGREWRLPHLNFRAIKAIQPTLFELYVEISGEDASPSLSEGQLDRLAQATWRAVATVDPALSYQDFLDLCFSVGDLIGGFPSLALAAGLRPAGANEAPAQATQEGSQPAGKSLSTPS